MVAHLLVEDGFFPQEKFSLTGQHPVHVVGAFLSALGTESCVQALSPIPSPGLYCDLSQISIVSHEYHWLSVQSCAPYTPEEPQAFQYLQRELAFSVQ